MFTGHGELVLHDGHRVALSYEFVDTGHGGRTGHLRFDMALLDPAAFYDCMELNCADGTALRIAVTSHSDKNACFVGKVIEAAA